jgi:competence protein ComEA
MSRSDRIVLAAGGGALVLAAAAAWLLFAPAIASPGAALVPSTPALLLPSMAPASGVAASGTIVVDVQGAVAAPGVRELPAGSRVADAIDAAGGYAADADLVTASATINLAQPLTDGAQVRVPRIGDAVAAAGNGGEGDGDGGSGSGAGGGGAGGGGTDGGPINLNTATPEELEALPGIGPVTVQKIVAARAERPFASLEDAVERGVMNRGQLEDIQGLATAG